MGFKDKLFGKRKPNKKDLLQLIADILDKRKADESSVDFLLNSLQNEDYMVRFKSADAVYYASTLSIL
jgi:hypothetical protein